MLERVVDAPRELLWTAWTKPEHVRQWFTPKPWIITDCEIDLRPGGLFRTRMQSPDRKEVSDRHCCYLDIAPNARLVWTDALLPGYRPSGDPFITAVISLQPEGKATHYTATAIHRDEATCKNHEEMGFFDGLGHRVRSACTIRQDDLRRSPEASLSLIRSTASDRGKRISSGRAGCAREQIPVQEI